jgi:predicted esterase
VKLSLAVAAALGLALGGAGPPMTGPTAPLLKARPSAGALTLPAGETLLANGAIAYRPATVPAGPVPLIVILHGAAGYPLGFLQAMEPEADRRGAVLLYPRSKGMTWDMVENVASGDEHPWLGPDAHRIDQSLADLFTHAAVDKNRIVLLGFSDGASYALSLGAANARLFTAVVALSPGIYVPPARFDGRQRIFIAHGRVDHVLSFDNTKEMVENLRRDGAKNLRFRPFDGDHEIDRAALTEALDFALGR